MEPLLLLPPTLPSPSPSPPPPTQLLSSSVISSPWLVSSTPTPPQQQFDPNPSKKKKKRSKKMTMIEVDCPSGRGAGSSLKVRIVTRKPDPNAPKIAHPCTECGKQFRSWKALYGHMRCHPERQWRGINPPPNVSSSLTRSPGAMETKLFHRVQGVAEVMTEEDHEVAECLLKLAACPVIGVHEGAAAVIGRTTEDWHEGLTMCQKFECSICKKVFGSHQALGGHRASHWNMKGCFVMTRGGDGRDEASLSGLGTEGPRNAYQE